MSNENFDENIGAQKTNEQSQEEMEQVKQVIGIMKKYNTDKTDSAFIIGDDKFYFSIALAEVEANNMREELSANNVYDLEEDKLKQGNKTKIRFTIKYPIISNIGISQDDVETYMDKRTHKDEDENF